MQGVFAYLTEHTNCREDPAACPDVTICPVLANVTLSEQREAERVAWEAERIAFEEELREQEVEAQNAAERELTSWAPLDLRGEVARTVPAYFNRTDGQALVYAGRTNSFVGQSEHGKSLAALLVTAQELLAGRAVIYVDFEGDRDDYKSMLLKLGVPEGVIASRSRYIRPEDPLDNAGKIAIRRACLEIEPSVIIFDGVTEAMMLHDLDDHSGIEVARFMNLLPRRLAACGVSVILVDHTPHGASRATGSQHKRSAVTGASFLFTRRGPLVPGKEGKVDITVLKDRPGQVRRVSAGGVKVGTLHISPIPEFVDMVEMKVEPVGEFSDSYRPAGTMERVSRYLEENDGSSRKKVREGAGGDVGANVEALDLLVLDGFAREVETPHGSQLYRNYWSVRPFRG